MARAANALTVTTSGTTVFLSDRMGGTDGDPMMGFRVLCLSGSCMVWAPPLLPLSRSGTLLSGVLLTATNADNNVWAPVSDINGAFTSVRIVGVGASASVAFRPEMGNR